MIFYKKTEEKFTKLKLILNTDIDLEKTIIFFDEIYNCYKNNMPMLEGLHEKLLNLYRLYLCVGGMPQAVQNIVDVKQNIFDFDKDIIRNIIDSYLNDMNQYILNNTEKSKIDILLDNNFLYKENIAENYVASQLVRNGISLYYWKSNSDAEIDFILYNQDGLIPIEVKASDNITSKSLNSYVKKYNPKYSIRVSSKNFGFENNIKSVPLYATFLIK